MYSPINSSKPPKVFVENLKKEFEKANIFRIFQGLIDAFSITWQEIENLYRLFRENEPDKKGSGGGGATSGSGVSTPKLGSIDLEFEAENLEYPAMMVGHRIWNDTYARKYFSTNSAVKVLSISGCLWVENPSASTPDRVPKEYIVRLYPQTGELISGSKALLGFDLGFDYYDAFRSSFAVYITEFSENLDHQIDETKKYTKKYVTAYPVLDNTLVTSFHDSGLRFKCQLQVQLEYI